MRLTELIPRKAILPNLKAADRRSAIQQLVKAVKTAHDLSKLPVAAAVEAVMKRENIGTTGLGGGVAVPHARVEGLSRVVGAFGRTVRGLDFNALDGEPVYLLFLILSPTAAPEEYQKALQQTLMAIRRPNFCRFLRDARSAKEIEDLFREAEESLASVT